MIEFFKNTAKEMNFSFGGVSYKKNYYEDGPETYTIINKTIIISRLPTHHDTKHSKDDFSKQYQYDVKGFEVVFAKPIAIVQSTGYWKGYKSGSYYKFECPFDYNLSDEENKFKIKSFCDTLNSILKLGSLEKYQEHLILSKNKIINEFLANYDSHHSGEIEVTESNDFMKLIENNINTINEFSRTDNRSYTQIFIKLNNFLDDRKNNIQLIYDYIKSDKLQTLLDFEYAIEVLEKQIKTYNLILFNSLLMVNCLCKGDLLTFYKIYECFDKLNVWNSNWENEMTKELRHLNKNIELIVKKIDSIEQYIIEGFYSLNKSITGGFDSLQNNIVKELKYINSNIDYGNLFSTITAFQTYAINKKQKV